MVAEVAHGLYRLPGVGPGVSAYVWHPQPGQRGPGEPIVFDCGYPWSGPGLVASLVALGCQPEDVRGIAITHDDFDHVGRVVPLQTVSQAAVYAHELEVPRLASEAWRVPPGVPGPLNWVAGGARMLFNLWPHHAVQVSHPLRDGDELPGGWIAVHTPGHTPGHTSYFHPATRILIAGDALGYRGRRLRFPMPVYTEDPALAASSIRKLASLEPSIVCCGHGGVLYEAAAPLAAYAASL